MIRRANLILYVSDQQRSRDFYAQVLQLSPTLDVPGMTEFSLSDSLILGLMPEKGIVRLLGNSIKDPALATGIPRAELYLSVEQPQQYHQRALQAGATELKTYSLMNWGDMAAYSLDPDGHVLVFASTANAD
mgnify:FL=1